MITQAAVGCKPLLGLVLRSVITHDRCLELGKQLSR